MRIHFYPYGNHHDPHMKNEHMAGFPQFQRNPDSQSLLVGMRLRRYPLRNVAAKNAYVKSKYVGVSIIDKKMHTSGVFMGRCGLVAYAACYFAEDVYIWLPLVSNPQIVTIPKSSPFLWVVKVHHPHRVVPQFVS